MEVQWVNCDSHKHPISGSLGGDLSIGKSLRNV